MSDEPEQVLADRLRTWEFDATTHGQRKSLKLTAEDAAHVVLESLRSLPVERRMEAMGMEATTFVTPDNGRAVWTKKVVYVEAP